VTAVIGILGTGDMGSAVARCLVAEGLEVATALEGRSMRSKTLAGDAGMLDKGSLNELVEASDIILSIMPPAAARQFAERLCPLIAASGRDVLFVDCNAVSPATIAEIASVAESHGVRFHDVGIVGAAPRIDRAPVRFYSSGAFADEVGTLAVPLIDVRVIGDQPGKASALKMVYASLTKGTNALRAAALMAGEALGVGEQIRAEWQESLPDAWQVMERRMAYFPSVAARWTGEMREIADTYRSAGLTPRFHEGAEWIYELLADADVSPDEDIGAALDAFMAALARR
jgi:3-hydroxyisobutyrate dehydrogenase-like beta-hydroxyacid dehydrogenase